MVEIALRFEEEPSMVFTWEEWIPQICVCCGGYRRQLFQVCIGKPSRIGLELAIYPPPLLIKHQGFLVFSLGRKIKIRND